MKWTVLRFVCGLNKNGGDPTWQRELKKAAS